jgi:hypothetical protein
MSKALSQFWAGYKPPLQAAYDGGEQQLKLEGGVVLT